MSKAEERALEVYPRSEKYTSSQRLIINDLRDGFIQGYKQAEKDILAIVKEYLEKGLRCMELSDKFQIHTFWDGFHNCAENILRELEEEK